MYSSDAHTNVYKGSIAVWRGVGKSARGMRRGMFRSRADQWRENMVATGCGIHQRRYSAYTFWDLSFLLSSLLLLLYLFFLFSLFLFHFDRSRVYTSVYNETPKGVCEKKKLLPLRIFAIKGTAFVGSFHLIFHCRGKKIIRPYLHLLSATWKRIIAFLSESTVYGRFWKVTRFHGYARTQCIVSRTLEVPMIRLLYYCCFV